MNYEMLYIIDGRKSEEERKTLVEKVNALVVKNGGNVTNVDEWGMRKLAYPINYTNEGYYVIMTFEAPVSAPKTICQTLNITDGIVRQMCIQK